MKKIALVLTALTSMSFADVNSCNFDFIEGLKKITNNVKNTTDLVLSKNNFHKRLNSVVIYSNGLESNVNKYKLKFSKGDYYEYNKDDKELCILKEIDYNFKKFKENGYLEFLKEITSEHNIDYILMLAIFKRETRFDDSKSGGFGRMTNDAIEEVNKKFHLSGKNPSEIRKLLVNNQKLAITYSVLYYKHMKNKHSEENYLAVEKYNGNYKKAINSNLTIAKLYVQHYKRNYKIISNNYDLD